MTESDFNIGQKLQRARRDKHIHLSLAAKDLCIPKNYLKAFEDNDLKQLPEPIYAVGFMRTYADYLGLNPDPLVEGLKARFNHTPSTKRSFPDVRNSSPTALGIFLFLGLAGSLGYFGITSMAGPTYEVKNADAIPDHVATLLEEEDEAEKPNPDAE